MAQERELLGLSFTQEVHLDTASLQRALGHMRQRHANLALRAAQIVVNDDPEYELLLRKLHDNIDNIGSRPNYSAKAEQVLRSNLEQIEELEKWLAEGVAAMLSQGKSMNAVYWFAKLVRGRIVYMLWSSQRSDDPNSLQYGCGWMNAHLGANDDAAAFFETDEVDAVDIWKMSGTRDDYFYTWMSSEVCSRLRSSGSGGYFGVCGSAEADKYVFPQMLLRHLRLPKSSRELIWDLRDAMIGLH